MKSLYLTFDDKEFEKMNKIKKLSKLSWERFIFELISKEKNENN